MDLGLRDRVYLVPAAAAVSGLLRRRHLSRTGPASCSAPRMRRPPRRPWHASRRTPQLTLPPGSSRITPIQHPGPLIAAARDRFGRLDGALISVGGSPPGTVAATSDEAWRSAFESVFLGAVRLAGLSPRIWAAPATAARWAAPSLERAARSSSCWPPRCACRSRNWPSPTGCSRAWPGWSRRSPGNWARQGPDQRAAARDDRHRPGP